MRIVFSPCSHAIFQLFDVNKAHSYYGLIELTKSLI